MNTYGVEVQKSISQTPDIEFIELDEFDDPLVSKVAELHVEYLPFGAMSALGSRFVRKVGYELPLKCKVMECIVCRINGSEAGYIAYARSTDFRRQALSQRFSVGLATAQALIRKPSRIGALIHSLRVARSFNKTAIDSGGEITAIVVKPDYSSSSFIKAAGFRPSEKLLDLALEKLAANGVPRARGLVDGFNKAMLFLYAKYGAEFTETNQAGRKMVEVWVDTSASSKGR